MSLLKIKHFLFFGIIMFGVFTACTEPECTSTTDPKLRIRFLMRDSTILTTGGISYNLEDTAIRIISVKGIGNPSVYPIAQIVDNDTTLAESLISYMSEVADTMSLVIKWDTAGLASNRNEMSVFTDTIQFSYTRQPYFVSEGCGFNYKFKNIAIRKETFTSSLSKRIRTVTVANPIADETLQPNINIVFYMRTE